MRQSDNKGPVHGEDKTFMDYLHENAKNENIDYSVSQEIADTLLVLAERILHRFPLNGDYCYWQNSQKFKN